MSRMILTVLKHRSCSTRSYNSSSSITLLMQNMKNCIISVKKKMECLGKFLTNFKFHFNVHISSAQEPGKLFIHMDMLTTIIQRAAMV